MSNLRLLPARRHAARLDSPEAWHRFSRSIARAQARQRLGAIAARLASLENEAAALKGDLEVLRRQLLEVVP